ncbi:MAG: ammonia-forming cytochrome c nitrite reductase subunit c552, partial [Bacteroidetes bacterium]|nr:ammonia-forming cytochrome c nitrite reductase subunit c552 [Bacteroidota bacterium]
ILYKLGVEKEIPYPDIATKAKAQQFVGLDMTKLRSEKAEFIQTVLPEWKEIAKEREAKY